MRLFATWLCVVIFGLVGAAAFAGTGGGLQEVQIETEGRPVLLGFDPVLLVGGQEAKGREDITAEHDGYVYAFVSEENRKKFVADPSRYEIQFRGACASMVGQGAGPKSGDADRFHVYKERIYIFASATCREHLQEDPERYVDRPSSWREPTRRTDGQRRGLQGSGRVEELGTVTQREGVCDINVGGSCSPSFLALSSDCL